MKKRFHLSKMLPIKNNDYTRNSKQPFVVVLLSLLLITSTISSLNASPLSWLKETWTSLWFFMNEDSKQDKIQTPTLAGGTDIFYVSDDCGQYSYGDGNATVDNSIGTGVALAVSGCNLPVNFTYNLSGAFSITEFWIETKVGSQIDNGVKDFTVNLFDGLNGTGNQVGTTTATAALNGVWQSFPITGSNVQSFVCLLYTSPSPRDS